MKSKKVKLYRQDIKNLLDYLEGCALLDLSVFSPPIRGLIKYHSQELIQKLLAKYNEMAQLRWNDTREISIKFSQLCILSFLFNKIPVPVELMNLSSTLICNTGEDLGEQYPVAQDLQTLQTN